MAAKQGQRRDWNLSANNRGMMGYRTPNIDRMTDEGTRQNPATFNLDDVMAQLSEGGISAH